MMPATNFQKQSSKVNSLPSTGQAPNAKGNKKTKKNRNRNKGPRVDTKSIPLARATIQISRNPIVRNTPTGCVVDHEELLTTLLSGNNNAFSVINRFRLNPGSYLTFPWLSSLAQNFEFYRFRKLKFIYRTRTSATTSGIIMFSPDYDAADGSNVFNNIESQLYSNKGSIESALYRDFVLEISTASMNRLYKSHTVMSDDRFDKTKQDQKTVDAGQLFIGTENQLTVGTPLGKLIVKYEVEFFQPSPITEKLSLGGHAMSYDGISAGGSSKPFYSPPTVNIPQPGIEKLLLTGQEMSNITGLLPGTVQANCGIFTRDWEGLLASQVGGSGISNAASYFLGPSSGVNDTLDAGVPGDLPIENALGALNIINPGSTLQSLIYKITAKKGDRLRMRSNSATSLSNFQVRLGGILSELL